MDEKCPICDNNATIGTVSNIKNGTTYLELSYNCPHCGNYIVSNTRVIDYFGHLDRRNLFLLSCYMKENKEQHDSNPHVRLDKDELVLISQHFPKTPEEKIKKILAYVSANTSFFGKEVRLSPEVSYSENAEELGNLIDELSNQDLVNVKSKYINGNVSVSLTINGINYVKGKSLNTQRDSCFVAMWFNPIMDELWTRAIKPVCEEAGYTPIRVDKEQFNDDITLHIIEGIKKSFFVIADLTGFRGGVYYEAGFARGLGKEVILCCKKDYKTEIKYEEFDEMIEEHGPHFDVNHLNTIYWKADDFDAFKTELRERILQTVGRGMH